MADDLYEGSMSSEGKAAVGRRMIGHMKEGFSKKESMGMEEEDRFAERERVWKRRLREMFNIKSEDEEKKLWDRVGGMRGMIDKFQMVEDEDYRRNYDAVRDLLDRIRSPLKETAGQTSSISKAADEAQ